MINKLQKFYQNHKELLLSLAVIAIFVVLGMSDAWADNDDKKVALENAKEISASTVIGEVRQSAINVIEHIKAIAYIMGGFGLIGLAWGAIFGKINWKWFSSLAIGLFIISWMGMTIDYFTRTGDAGIAATAFKTTGPSGVGCEGDCFGDKAAGLLGGTAVSGATTSNAGSNQNLTPEQQKANAEAQKKEQERQKWCDSNSNKCSECGEDRLGICEECAKKECNLYEEDDEITFSCDELYQKWSDAMLAGKENEASAWSGRYLNQGCPRPSAEQIRKVWCRGHFVQCASCGSMALTSECEECKKNNCINSGNSSSANSCEGCDNAACSPVSAKYATCSRNNCCPNN